MSQEQSTPPAISGYRDLSPEEIQMINAVKGAGESVRELLDLVAKMPGVDKRWISIGQTQLQQGFMAVVRAIARPTTF